MKLPVDATHAFMGRLSLVEVGEKGCLASATFAVKDVIDVAGHRTGAGNPCWLQHAPLAALNAPCIEDLVDAGATLLGSTITDELAFSLSGTNVHYGTPLNPNAPGCIPGGSSAGSASAVAAGTVTFALGTDTAGSIRVPASYCGVWGLRPSHGRVSMTGVVPLAPSFDTIGVLSSSGSLLTPIMDSLLGSNQSSSRRDIVQLVGARDLFDLVVPTRHGELMEAAISVSEILQVPISWEDVMGPNTIAECRDGFRRLQMVEVWKSHGRWIEKHNPHFGPGVGARFDLAAKAVPVPDYEVQSLKQQVIAILEHVMLAPNALLLVPVTPSGAPPLFESGAEKERLRQNIISLNSIAGISGAPELSCPIFSFGGSPIGLGVLGLPGDDELLCKIAGLLFKGGFGRLASRKNAIDGE